MSKESTIQFRAWIQIGIMLIALIVAFKLPFNHWTLTLWTILIGFLAPFPFIYLLLQRKIQKEKRSYQNEIHPPFPKICFVVICLNEMDTIKKTLDHYMQFDDHYHMRIYDDHSTDGTDALLFEYENNYPDRISVVKNPTRDLSIHPRAFGIEDAFQTVDADFFIILDADTIIAQEESDRAIGAMENQKMDALHIGRRNDFQNTISCKMADIHEWLVVLLYITHLNKQTFQGSGIFVRKSAVREFSYDEQSISDDHYLGKFLNERKNPVETYITLNVHERAPENIYKYFSQRFHWIRCGIQYYLLHSFVYLCFATFMFASILASVIYPFSVMFIISIFLLFSLTSVVFISKSKLNNKIEYRYILYGFLFFFISFITYCIIYPYLLFVTATKKDPLTFKKNE